MLKEYLNEEFVDTINELLNRMLQYLPRLFPPLHLLYLVFENETICQHERSQTISTFGEICHSEEGSVQEAMGGLPRIRTGVRLHPQPRQDGGVDGEALARGVRHPHPRAHAHPHADPHAR